MKTLILTTMLILAQTAFTQETGLVDLIPTPEQTVGPFYPGYKVFQNADNNMSNTKYKRIPFPTEDWGSVASSDAKGSLLRISGQVLDKNGQPVPGAEVQFWQTDGDQGRYLVEKTDKPLDPNFEYVGKDMTLIDGTWTIATVRPKEYEADEDWVRPDHIHVRVFIKGHLKLTTQLYFSDDQELIGKDRILQALTPEQRAALIIEVKNIGVKNELAGNIRLILK